MFAFLKSKQQRQLEELRRRTEQRVVAESAVAAKISLEIIRASHECTKRTRFLVPNLETKSPFAHEFYFFFEYVYFFSCLAGMYILALASKNDAEEMHRYLGNVIPDVAVDSYFASWPIQAKAKAREQFIEKLAAQEDEYWSLMEKAESHDERFGSLFGKLCQNVVQLSGREEQWLSLRERVLNIVMEEARKSRFDVIVRTDMQPV